MTTLILTFILFVLAMAGLAIGQIVRGKPMICRCGKHGGRREAPPPPGACGTCDSAPGACNSPAEICCPPQRPSRGPSDE